ncbi:hypothetical protein AsAng_0051120 [Aureispira anguillae]|uniref:Uncharacterized protein n=1 Tax=Aureispira anguillae TaxID=2864201 RepID=A0A915YJN8_9BACT|nr:hypothetical protein AsAng_0051120 [Aureispira anguillae]
MSVAIKLPQSIIHYDINLIQMKDKAPLSLTQEQECFFYEILHN